MSPQAWKLLDAAARGLDTLGTPVRARGARAPRPTGADGTDELVRRHFAARSSPEHINVESMLGALELLEERPGRIVETGASAWGTDSTRLFSDYVDTFGGELWSVDIRLKPLVDLRGAVSRRTLLTCGDSVRFLRRWVRSHRTDTRVDLVYLDSYDLDVEDPYPAARHGLRELLAIRPALQRGSLLLVDDTPATPELCPDGMREPAERFLATHGAMPGKGMLIEQYLDGAPNVTKVHHAYQVLYRFD